MKILQVVKNFDFGGAENYVQELSCELASQGFDVFILGRGGRQCSKLPSNITFIDSGWNRAAILHILLIIRLIKRHNIDLIHAHQRLPIFSTSVVSFFTGVPVVVTVHGRVRYDLRSWLSRTIPRFYIFVSRQVLMVSGYREMLEPKSVIIPNGITICSNSHSLKPFSIGYMSRIDTKHAATILQLVELIPRLSSEFGDVTLFIYGDGKELDLIRTRAVVLNSQLGREAVVVRGYVQDIKTMEEFPELVLGVGRVAIEAAQKGCVVLPVNSRRLGRMVTVANYDEYRINNFVDVNADSPTPQSLYDSLAGFYNNREVFCRQSRELAVRVTNDYDLRTIAAQIARVYGEALKVKAT